VITTYNKMHRAANPDDYERWGESDVAPTQNVFDVGDIRATTIIVDDEPLPSYTVRRLTPVECERLQGFPDDWTAVQGASDTQRYKQIGNAVTVNVIEYLGELLHAADERHAE